jgi:GNAT superfamily N-acetyltransferase
MRSHVAQVNIATLRAPIDHESITEFRDGLAPVNAAGEAAAGYVWRLQTDDGDATSIRVSDDPLSIVNLTVWESIDALRAFAYGGLHRDFLRRRADWFTDAGRRTAVWRIPAGSLPTVDDAVRRAEFIERFGPSPYAFASVASSRANDWPELVIASHPLGAPESQALIAELNAQLIEVETPGENHFFELTAEQVAPGAGDFVVAWLDGAPVGCGAFRLIGEGTAEIKRMFVRPSGRGQKIGAAVLHHLEGAAIASGATRLALETGANQVAAQQLYRRFGFESCPPWGEYIGSHSSICLAKPLSPSPG